MSKLLYGVRICSNWGWIKLVANSVFMDEAWVLKRWQIIEYISKFGTIEFRMCASVIAWVTLVINSTYVDRSCSGIALAVERSKKRCRKRLLLARRCLRIFSCCNLWQNSATWCCVRVPRNLVLLALHERIGLSKVTIVSPSSSKGWALPIYPVRANLDRSEAYSLQSGDCALLALRKAQEAKSWDSPLMRDGRPGLVGFTSHIEDMHVCSIVPLFLYIYLGHCPPESKKEDIEEKNKAPIRGYGSLPSSFRGCS